MNRIKLNDNNSNKGIETYYYPDQKHLHIDPTNCEYDWFWNIVGWILGLLIINVVWFYECIKLLPELENREIKSISGHSKGGAQAFYLWVLLGFKDIRIFVFGAFPAWPLIPFPGDLYIKRGDFFPLFSWFWQYDKVHWIGNRRQPISIAHWWSRTEIESTIMKELEA